MRRPARLAAASCALLAAALLVPTLSGPASAEHGTGRAWLPATPDQWPLVVDEQTTAKQSLTRGVQQWSDHLDTAGGAQRAQLLDVDLTDPNVRLGVVESHDHLTDTADEVPSSMAHRTGAVAGINADFFEIYGSGRPEGMVVIDGQLVKSPNPDRPWNLWVRADGSIGIGAASYSGTVTAGSASHPLTSVNTVDDLSDAGGALVRVTPYLGAPAPVPASTVVAGTVHGGTLTVTSVTAGVTDLAQLPVGTEELVGTGEAATWLAANAHPGDTLAVAERTGPDSGIRQAVSGGAILVQDGQRAVPLQGPGENNVNNPETAVGVTKDGRHAIFAAFDGHQAEGVAQGLTRPQLAGWMMRHGAYNAILFDSGGSTQLVGRLPGQAEASVLNVPSDGHERPVANGLFVYSTAPAPGPATRAVVNAAKPLVALRGTTVDVPGYATDAAGNPARDAVRLDVSPPSLATVDGTRLTAHRAGTGTLTIRAGRAVSHVPFTVVDRLGKLAVTPGQLDLNNGTSQRLALAATDARGRAVSLPPAAVSWHVDPAGLGTVGADGTFTAAASGTGMATVSASAGGAGGTVSVAVGQTSVTVDPLDSAARAANWSVTDQYMNVYPRKVPSPGPTSTSDGAVSFDPATKRLPTDAGSLDVHYDYPYVSKTLDLSVYLNDPASEQIPLLNGSQAPIGIGVWVKGNADLATRPGKPLDPGIVSLNVGIWQASNQPTSFYPSGVTWDGWQYVVASLPTGLQYPLRINYLGLVVIKPGPNLTGDIHLSGLSALYSPRPPTPFRYHPLPANPSWLKFTDVGSFTNGGSTLAAMDDAHVSATDPGGTGPVGMRTIASDLGALPASARPQQVQALGDMPDSGTPENLNFAKSLLDGLGVPYRDAVGNHEITQGANPENGNYAATFGATHYSYPVGAANVIVSDSAHIGILASDAYQNVDTGESQYRWLADQLTANRSKVAIVVTHAPAYDPHPRADSQFTDRWEARMYEELMIRYQRSHPGTHVMLLFGHSRGFAENLFDASGADVAGGLPNFVVADAGSPPYAATDQGGFYHYALFHVLPDGTVQFAVQPLLASVAIATPHATLARGGTEQLTATGTSVTGDNASPLAVPIADPVSRAWSSSNPSVASVDPRSGQVTAHRTGTATITLTVGGTTASTTLTVIR
jgi:exopolysaccharide biosynthesis protein